MKTARLTKLSLFSFTLLVAASVKPICAQSALDGFDPNANGSISAIAVQSDGKILLGGAFTTLSPNGGTTVTRNHIARLNPDGTLDMAFDPNANGNVYAIAVQADGKILVGGNFHGANSIGGQTRNYIARLDATTGAADSFNPNADVLIESIAIQPDGKILAGGGFTSIGGQQRNSMARLDPATGLADSFNPNVDNFIYTIAVQDDGKILIGGAFTNVGNHTRNRIARVNTDGTLDGGFDPDANGSPFGYVFSIAVQPDGKILAGGHFNSIGGQTRNNIARLDATIGAADSFNPNANNDVESVVVEADGKILVGGLFNGTNSIGGQTRNRIARLDPASGLADSFDPNASGSVLAIAAQADGKILAGGSFSGANSIGGQTRNRIARLETDGRLDRTLNLSIMSTSSDVLATAVQADGKILIGGYFDNVSGVTRNYIARLNTDGTLDTAFDPNANGIVNAIATQADGKILAAGSFTSIGGQTRNYIARLDPTTGLADSFNPNANEQVSSIAVQVDGKILAGGFFTSIGGQTRNYIARLDPTTGLADSFDPNALNGVLSIAVQADGKILTDGFFTNIGGQTRNHIARLDPTTGLADSFDPNADLFVDSIAVQADGKILAGGEFSSIGGQTRNYIARLDPTTGLADSFDPNPDSDVHTIAVQADGKILAGGFFSSIGGQTRNYIARLDATTGAADSLNPNPDSFVSSIAVQADGKILAGGTFYSIGGQTRNVFARLTNDTAALQDLAATPITINWTRGGSNPQFTRVIFEYSTNNVNYSLLGNGTASGSNWTLTGLNLPTGQNFYIRARGYYRSGVKNASESVQESVRNVFLPAVPTVISAVSRKTHGGSGTFDVNLPFTGAPGIECRTGGATSDYTMVLNFSGSVTVTGNPQAEVTSGSAVVGSGGVSNGGMVTVNGNVVTVPLTNFVNAQTINVRLNGVNGAGNVDIPMGLHVGDTSGNGIVNASDVSQTKARIGQSVGSSNFRSDVNANGSINATDVTLIKANIGN